MTERVSAGVLILGLGLLGLAAVPSARADGDLIFTEMGTAPTIINTTGTDPT